MLHRVNKEIYGSHGDRKYLVKKKIDRSDFEHKWQIKDSFELYGEDRISIDTKNMFADSDREI